MRYGREDSRGGFIARYPGTPKKNSRLVCEREEKEGGGEVGEEEIPVVGESESKTERMRESGEVDEGMCDISPGRSKGQAERQAGLRRARETAWRVPRAGTRRGDNEVRLRNGAEVIPEGNPEDHRT